MTNEEFLKWENLVYKVANKFINNSYGLDQDDLFQVGSIGLITNYDKYTEEKGMSLVSYLYNNVQWAILRELEKYKRIDDFIHIPLEKPTGEDITVEDTLEDLRINIEDEVLDRIVLEEYINEIEKHLNDKEREVIFMKVFDEMSYKQIEDNLKLEHGESNKIYIKARRKLLHRSYYIKERYMSYIEATTNIYRNPADVVIERNKYA